MTLFWAKSNALILPITVELYPDLELVLSSLLFNNLRVSENPISGVPKTFVISTEFPIRIGTLWLSTNFVVLGFKTSMDEEDILSTS